MTNGGILGTSAAVWLTLAVIAIVLVIAWIILPFILMNTNAYLRRLLREQQRTNELLESLRFPRPRDTEIPSVRVEPRTDRR